MTNPQRRTAGHKKSGGMLKANMQALANSESPTSGDSEDVPSPVQKASTAKTIIVHDARGQIVSITRVSPDAKHGVGVKAQPGFFVKEIEVTGTLAEETLPHLRDHYQVDVKTQTLVEKKLK